jgi:hypothetical protein
MRKLNTFYQCCRYLDISIDLPECQIDQKQIQAAYKLRVCMKAWNKQDGFKPDETANYYQEEAGYTPYFYFKNGRLLSSGYATYGSFAGLVNALASYAAAYTIANIGLRLCFITRKRAIEFSEIFIEVFNELIDTDE